MRESIFLESFIVDIGKFFYHATKINKEMITNYKKFIANIGIIIISIFVLFNCTSKNKTEEVSDEIVLKIGDVEITKYEFEKNKKRYYDPKSNYQEWVNSFINNTYYLADAYNKKYDTITQINKTVEYMSLLMISQVGGYLWRKVEEPKLEFSKSEIIEMYKKRDKVFYFEYLVFPDKKTLTSLLHNDTIIKSESDFLVLANKCKFNNTIKYENRVFPYPFSELWQIKDILYNLKEGEISTPLYTDNGIYIIRLSKIETTKQHPFKKEKQKLVNMLRQQKSHQIIERKQKEVFQKANMVFNEKVIKSVLNSITLYNIERNSTISNPTDTLINYQLNNKYQYLLVKDFMHYYVNKPFMATIEDKESLNKALENYVDEQYMYAEAENLGITKEKRYVLDKKNFKNKLIQDYYNKKEFSCNFNITKHELHAYYNDKKESFTEATSCDANLFTFKDLNTAMNSYGYINTLLDQGDFSEFSDTSSLRGLLTYQEDVNIQRDSEMYPAELIQVIFNSPLYELNGPFELTNAILYIKTKQEGIRVKTIEEVKDEIKNRIRRDKEDKLKNEQLNKLKNKYSSSIKNL